jgi:hypothetical protein
MTVTIDNSVAVLKRRLNHTASTMHTKGITSSLATCTATATQADRPTHRHSAADKHTVWLSYKEQPQQDCMCMEPLQDIQYSVCPSYHLLRADSGARVWLQMSAQGLCLAGRGLIHCTTAACTTAACTTAACWCVLSPRSPAHPPPPRSSPPPPPNHHSAHLVESHRVHQQREVEAGYTHNRNT